MNSMAMSFAAPQPVLRPAAPLRQHGLALAVAIGLHAAVVGALVLGWHSEPPEPGAARTLTTQLVILPPAPAPQPEAVAAPMPPPPVEQPVVQPVKPEPVATPKPPVDVQREARQLEQAALARKRVEEQRRVKEVEQRQAAERAKAAEQQRQLAEQRQLEQQQAEQARLAAQKALQAKQAQQQAAADISNYQPLKKEAPDYPRGALDKGIQGDCTVVYDVTPEGRVSEPKVQGACHPLFIRPSLAAALTFRYQPRLVDGRAVTVPGVKNTFHYRIE